MASNNGTATAPPTSESPPPPSSEPVTVSSAPPPSETPSETPTSARPPASSSAPPSSTPPRPSSSPAPRTSTAVASSRAPTTIVQTVVSTPSTTIPGQTIEPSTLVVTLVSTPTEPAPTNNLPPDSAETTQAGADLQGVNRGKDDGGLSTGGKTAIAVVVPVVVVGLLALAGIILWRRRKQKKNAEEARRKEVEEYGFNPNHDPTLPAVGIASEMTEDQSGYRGWGNTTTSSNRKASTTLTSGMTYSDSNSNPGGPNSPTQAHSDVHSNDPLMNGRRETLDSEGIGALGAAPNANHNQSSVHRGPSNASSSYSGADHSDNSGDYPLPINNPQDFYDNNGYYQPNQFGDPYGANQQPVIRDVSARRNTRIESPSVFPQQGNSGIAQNF